MISRLIETISAKDQFQAKYLKEAVADLSEEEKLSFESVLNYFISGGYDLDYLAKSYLVIVQDTMREQKYFFDYKKYRYASYDEVAGHVYDDPEYMHHYMAGLVLTKYLWHTHRQIMRWYESKSKTVAGDRYFEIGPGHGDYFASAMLNMKCKEYIAVDISETSVEMTKAFVKHFIDFYKISPEYSIINKNFLDFDNRTLFDVIIMGEVLEHVEQPLKFLQKIKNLASDDAFIYITTAINAPAVDHIYLFDSIGSVINLINEAGMKVDDYLAVTAQPSLSLEKAIRKKYPITIALVLKK